MKIILLQILQYVWSRKENLYSLYKDISKNKNIKIDGKTNLEEILEYAKIIKSSGLVIDDKEKEQVFTAGDIEEIEHNKSKNLVLYNQSSWSCVIYAMTRALMYNSKIFLTKDEIESIKEYARVKGYWVDKKGMTFKSGCRAIKGWLKENKNIDITYVREKIGSELYNEYTYELDYMSAIGGYMTNKFISDFKIDGCIDANYNWKETKKYGHCFTNYNSQKNEIDNYVRKFGDTNQRINKKQKDFIKNSYYFPFAYFLFCDYDIKIDKDKAKVNIIATKEIPNNRYWKHLRPHIEKGYTPIFNDYSDEKGEEKVLIDLAFIRKGI